MSLVLGESGLSVSGGGGGVMESVVVLTDIKKS